MWPFSAPVRHASGSAYGVPGCCKRDGGALRALYEGLRFGGHPGLTGAAAVRPPHEAAEAGERDRASPSSGRATNALNAPVAADHRCAR
jgi:hypothetical protein